VCDVFRVQTAIQQFSHFYGQKAFPVSFSNHFDPAKKIFWGPEFFSWMKKYIERVKVCFTLNNNVFTSTNATVRNS